MRLAFVSLETTRHSDTPGIRRFERVARLLAERGHEVTLFCGQWWDGHNEFFADGLQYRGVTSGGRSSFAARLPFALARHRPDIVHVRPSPPHQVRATRWGCRLARAPLAVEWFGNENLDSDSRLTRQAASKPGRIITPSELVQTRVRELGADEDQTRVIPESIDFARIEQVEPDPEVDIVSAHPLTEDANLDDVLLGLAELRERDWSATIVGEGPRRAEYETEAEELRIDDRVSFVGACDRERRIALYRGAHVFLQTAYREEFATELLWALACGCVGIVQYQTESSAHELIENHERSYRVTSPQQVADAVADAAAFDHQTRDDEWAAFDHDEVVDQYIDEYQQLLSEFGLL